jgi:hypothetical protein
MKEDYEHEMVRYLLNSRPLDEFDMLSPNEMHYLLYDPFGEKSPMAYSPYLCQEVIQKIPFFNLTSYYLNLIYNAKTVKLTSHGNLPTKMVLNIYSKKFIIEEIFEEGLYKLVKQSDSMTITNARLIAELEGLTKLRKNNLSLTQKGEKLLKTENQLDLFKEIFKVFTTKFNWAYNDGYGDNPIGQMGFAYSLMLISKYGNKERHFDFYAEKYKKAFPDLLETINEPHFQNKAMEMDYCYALRTFERFMVWFGFIEVNEKIAPDNKSYHLKKSEIFDHVFKFD